MSDVTNRWYKEGKRTLLQVTLSGHGVTVDGNAAIVCNETNKSGKFKYFGWEQYLRTKSEECPFLYVIALNDSCRTVLLPEINTA